MRIAQPDHDHHAVDGDLSRHPLLVRQMRRACVPEPLPASLARLLALVSAAYYEIDRERRRDDRATTLMSEELTTLNAAIRRQAGHDPLTGLANRALFMDCLRNALSLVTRSGRAAALLFVDLNDFKVVNDTLGHLRGDLLLKEVAKRLERCLRAGDTVARIGGDEFTVIMPAVDDVQQAARVAERIVATIDQPFDLNGSEAIISAAVGIAICPADAEDCDVLLAAADAAMFRAKDAGKGTYHFYTAGMDAEAHERVALKQSMARARDRGEFTLVYQPKLSLRSGRIAGVEALMRWDSAELGQVSPSKFIPVMEESGFIVGLGEWALDEACRQSRAWTDAGILAPRIAVNLSARQLRQPGLTRMIGDLLARHRLRPDAIELEVTESMIIRDAEGAAAVLGELRGMGIGIAMDDFGTGYSSLSYLSRFPFDSIKIDQSFVRDITVNSGVLAIVRAIVGMGHALKRRVVAEGVETSEQCRLLHRLRVDEVQGYAIGRPLPPDALLPMLKDKASPQQ